MLSVVMPTDSGIHFKENVGLYLWLDKYLSHGNNKKSKVQRAV